RSDRCGDYGVIASVVIRITGGGKGGRFAGGSFPALKSKAARAMCVLRWAGLAKRGRPRLLAALAQILSQPDVVMTSIGS
ncbi:MAG: hypothetical protein WA823_11270, partial [Candidatus Acidiferrales bacterium]